MNQRIVYKDNNNLCILIPAPECLKKYSIEQIAQKDVPFGKPYKIVDVNDLPTDRTFRAAWDIDEKLLTDGVGAKSNSFEGIEE